MYTLRRVCGALSDCECILHSFEPVPVTLGTIKYMSAVRYRDRVAPKEFSLLY